MKNVKICDPTSYLKTFCHISFEMLISDLRSDCRDCRDFRYID